MPDRPVPLPVPLTVCMLPSCVPVACGHVTVWAAVGVCGMDPYGVLWGCWSGSGAVCWTSMACITGISVPVSPQHIGGGRGGGGRLVHVCSGCALEAQVLQASSSTGSGLRVTGSALKLVRCTARDRSHGACRCACVARCRRQEPSTDRTCCTWVWSERQHAV